MKSIAIILLKSIAIPLLVWTLAAFALFAAGCVPAYAEGIVYTTPTKPVTCTNPTTNTDGSQIEPASIVKAIIYVSTTPDLSDHEYSMDIIGGCAPGVTFDLTQLSANTQYYTGGVFVTTGGQASMSNVVPFRRASPVPNPLIMVE